MNTLIWILLSTVLVSSIAFVGIFALLLQEKVFKKILLALVSLSAGALMGGAFIHLLPATLEKTSNNNIFLFVIVGFVLFFLVEKIIGWQHCHKGDCNIHTFAYMNLVGEAVHNFIDGLIIAASFIVSPHLGIATVLAVALHEIPQEIGDFGILVFGGFKKMKALAINFSVALTVVLGGIFGYFISDYIETSTIFLLPFAAGGFIYIAAADLIPEIRKEIGLKKSLINFSFFLIGIAIMLFIKVVVAN